MPVDHENLERFGWSERTDEGRRRVVRSALSFAAEIGVQVVVPPAGTPRELPEGAVVVSQLPPQALRSNGEWAGDLMKRVARHYLADAEDGPRAVESLLFYGLTGRTSADYAGALAQGLGYLRDRQQAPAARTGRLWLPDGVAEGDHAVLRAALLERVAAAGDLWGSPESPYVCARVLTRAHTERLCSPLALDAVRSELRPLPPSPYGDTLGGWFAWHLAETRPRFQEFEPAELAADCNEWLAARAAEDLLDKADLRCVVDGVPARLSSRSIRDALDALPVPPDDPAVYGMLVGDQAAGWNRHPLNRPRPQLDPVVGVEPAAFGELDSRRPDDAVVLEDRILGLCAGSGVAVKLHDSDRVRSFHAPMASRPGLGAHVVHPIPERFGSTEDWGRSLLSAVALAVQTHPRLYDHARLDRLFGKDPAQGARMFDDATRVLCERYRLNRAGVVARARAFEARPVGDRPEVVALDEIEDRTGVPPPRFEVARRAFWTALGDGCEREGVARGWTDAAIVAADHDHVMLERVRRAAFADVPLMVRGCDRVLDFGAGRSGGAVRPSGAVERSVADVVADRLLSGVGAAEPRMDLDQRDSPRVREALRRLAAANRPADMVLAKVAPGFAVGGDRDDATVLDIVRERGEAVTAFILDPTRARRSDRVRDVEHSRAGESVGGPSGRACVEGRCAGIRPGSPSRSRPRCGGGAGAVVGDVARDAPLPLPVPPDGPGVRVTGGVLDVLDCEAAAMHDEVRVVAVAVLVTVLGAGVGARWTSERGWPAEAVAVVAGVLSVYLGAAYLNPPLSSLAVAVVGLGCLAVGSVSSVLRSIGFVLLAAAVADARLAAVLGDCLMSACVDRPPGGGGMVTWCSGGGSSRSWETAMAGWSCRRPGR